MKKSEVERDLKRMREARSEMFIYNSGQSTFRGEVAAKIEIYERLLKEGYEDDSK